MPLDFFPPMVQEPGQYGDYDVDRLLKFRAFQQQTVVYMAAANTPENLRYMAKFKCDGTSDQETMIEALNYMGYTGHLVLLPGIYVWDFNDASSAFIDLGGSSNLTIQGSGIGNTHIRAKTRTAVGTDRLIWFDDTAALNNLTISDLTIDGNKAKVDQGDGTDQPFQLDHASNQDITFERVRFIFLDGSGTSTHNYLAGTNVRVTDCDFSTCGVRPLGIAASFSWVTNTRFYDNGYIGTATALWVGGDFNHIMGNNFRVEGGIEVSGSVGSIISNNNLRYTDSTAGVLAAIWLYDNCRGTIVANNMIEGAWAYGVKADNSTTTVSDMTIIGNDIYNVDETGISVIGQGINVVGNRIDTAGFYGIQLSGADYCNIDGNFIRRVDAHGIFMTGACDSNKITSNYVFEIGQATSNTYDGIHLANSTNMDHNGVMNNTVRGSSQHRYGINLVGSNTNNTLVANNDLAFSGATGAFNDAGTGTDVLGGNRT